MEGLTGIREGIRTALTADIKGAPMPDEDAILQHAEIIIEAVALSRAMLDRDIIEARFRARLVRSLAAEAGLANVANAAQSVVVLLGDGPDSPAAGYGEVIKALSVAIDEAQANL